MKTFKLGLITKITIIVGIVELIAFSTFGYIYVEKYAADLEKNLRKKISIINRMIANEQMPISSITDNTYMNEMIGQPYIDGFIVGSNGFVIVSSNSEYLGKRFENLPKFTKEWMFNISGEKFIIGNDKLSSIAYLNNFGDIPLYRTVITVSTKILNDKKNEILTFGMFGTFFFILFSSGVIVLFAKRIITQRVDDSLKVLKEAESGNLNSQIIVSQEDELGMLQFGINSMIRKVDKKTQELSKNIAFLKSHQLAMDESSMVSKSDLKGNITYVNDNFCKITGYTKDEVIGKPHNIVRHPSNSKEVFKELWETIKSKKAWKGILKNKGKLNDYWVDIAILPILDENKEIVEYIAIRHDITKMIHQQEKLDNIANTDSLTGYGNRYKLTQDIKGSKKPALAILNIDNFSQINDFYGYEKGDIVIKKLGDNIAKVIEKNNCKLYHLQGDEYVVFNKEISKDKFIKEMNYLTSKIKSTKIYLFDEELHLNLTTGISFETKDKVLSTADIALKVAKRNNTSLVIYSEEISLNKEYENNIKWTKKIKEAIANNNFVPVYQPIVNNSNNIWEKYESLVRLEDNGKLISPYFFLDISKKTKHYADITKIMIQKTFEEFQSKENEFSINLTIGDILNSEINEFIFEILKKYNYGSKIVFEIVESESIENFEQVQQFIDKIKSYHCKVAIDDFGTGYSNFEYLVKLKADYIKIDGSLIKDIDTNETSQIVVKNIINFAKDLGMKTIAEFVENESIFNKVKELGIDYSQGYYFSKPERYI